jgi:hypothetical protein
MPLRRFGWRLDSNFKTNPGFRRFDVSVNGSISESKLILRIIQSPIKFGHGSYEKK